MSRQTGPRDRQSDPGRCASYDRYFAGEGDLKRSSSAREMISLVRSRGVIVKLGVFKKPVEVDMQAVNFKEFEILGSRIYERKDFQEAIEFALRLPLERMVSHTVSLILPRQGAK